MSELLPQSHGRYRLPDNTMMLLADSWGMCTELKITGTKNAGAKNAKELLVRRFNW